VLGETVRKGVRAILGPGFVVGVGNGLMLGYLMYSSALVPQPRAMLGLIGGPPIIASGVGVVLGSSRQGAWQASPPSLSSSGSCRLAYGSL